MPHKLKILLSFIFVLILIIPKYLTAEDFSIDNANRVFDQISLKLSVENLKYENFETAIINLKELNEKAQICYQNNQQKLKQVNERLKELDISNNSQTISSSAKYLLDKKSDFEKKALECRLCQLRSEEAIISYNNTLHELTTLNLLQREDFSWKEMAHYFSQVNSKIIFKNVLTVLYTKWYFFILVIVLYVLYIVALRWVLHHPVKSERFSKIENLSQYKRAFHNRMQILGFIGFIGIFLQLIFIYHQNTLFLSQFFFELTIVFCSIILWWNAFLLRIFITYKPLYLFIILIISIILFALVLFALFGFHNLSRYLLTNIFLTIIGLIAALFINTKLKILISQLEIKNHLWQIKLHDYFGFRKNKKIPEIIILKVISTIFVIMAYLVYLSSTWGFKTIYPEKFILLLTDGFSIFNITIDPMQIIIALLIFVLLCFVGRFISTNVSKKHQNKEKDLQVALASIVGYITVSIAILIALLIAGVNFTGLAIIAGALSVGVGLGLQDIVKNFVSGIVLLLEKPIRPGDRIIIDNTEGFVKKVRIRSTQITTMSKSDVIVPNADFINKQVTNYMFRDPLWRISCQVGVAYGSDTELVKKTLLDVASKHPNVLQDKGNEPIVLFREFADSSLTFELWCIVKNVNDKFIIQSELNFAIDQAFRENNITIAFPQRDVHFFDHSNNPKK